MRAPNPVRLAHIHLPGIVRFNTASKIQETLVRRLLDYKSEHAKYQKLQSTSSSSSSSSNEPPIPIPPDPTILTFTPDPIYTTGRRDLPPSTSPNPPLPSILTPILPLLNATPPLASWTPTLRGGQTTYHGPGQLVAYTILDLQRLGLGPREHIRLLEESVIDVLGAYGVQGQRTGDPGVWVPRTPSSSAAPSSSEGNDGEEQPRKICAVGVHLRRYVSSFGIGLNVSSEPMFFFRQIVACGLEGREATSLEGEGVPGLSVEEVAEGFVRAFVRRYNEGYAPEGIGLTSFSQRMDQECANGIEAQGHKIGLTD